MTKREVELKRLKKGDIIREVIAGENRIEYLKDKITALEEKLKGLDELQRQYEEEVKQLAFLAGGMTRIPMKGTLKDYDVQVTLVKKAE